MRTPLLLLAVLFLAWTCGRAQTPVLPPVETVKSWEKDHRWTERHDLDGRFRVIAPATLTHAVDSIETTLGQQVYHTFHLQAPDVQRAENVIYALSYVDYPAGSLHQDSTELLAEFLSTTETEAAAAVGGETIYATHKTIGGYPARQWRIDYPSRGGTASARTLAVVAGNRYYELKVFARSERGTNDSADRFFDSLRIFAPDHNY